MLKMFHQTMLHRNSAVFMSCFQNNFGESFSCEWRRRRRGRKKKRDLGIAKKFAIFFFFPCGVADSFWLPRFFFFFPRCRRERFFAPSSSSFLLLLRRRRGLEGERTNVPLSRFFAHFRKRGRDQKRRGRREETQRPLEARGGGGGGLLAIPPTSIQRETRPRLRQSRRSWGWIYCIGRTPEQLRSDLEPNVSPSHASPADTSRS